MENSIINIGRLLNYIFQKWRKIAVSMFILSFVFGVLGVWEPLVRQRGGLEQNEGGVIPVTEEELEQYTEKKAAIESEIVAAEGNVDILLEYVDNSMLMKTDYQNISQTAISMIITPSDALDNNTEEYYSEIIQKITSSYTLNMLDSEFYEDIRYELNYDMDVSYIREFVYSWVDLQVGQFTILIKSNDLQENQIIATVVMEYFQEFHQSINMQYPHELKINEPISSIIVEDYYKSHQDAKIEQLRVAEESLRVLKDELEALEEPTDQIVEPLPSLTSIQLIFRVILFMSIGAIIGAGGAILCIALYPILTNKIQDGRYITNEYDLTVLGERPQFPQKKNRIDKLIFRIFNKTSYKEKAEFYSYIATRINLVNSEERSICLLGSLRDDILQETCNKLREKVKADISYCGNIGESESNLNTLLDADLIFLVEQIFVTTDEGLHKEISLVKELNKDIKGAIVL